MIPADVASRMQVSADAALRQVAPAQEITDKLSGLVAGQKVMAEIQSMLPNGTYRAMINQRSITLALPFSAKSGDSLELLVTDSNGKLALAVSARPDADGGKTAGASTATTLSRTGQLISTLLSPAADAKGRAPALALNANQPISTAPQTAQALLPLLKLAISQSGMFYESHQAEWVEGRFSQAALLKEPQGKLSAPSAFSAAASAEPEAKAAASSAQQPPAGRGPALTAPPAGREAALAGVRPAGEAVPGVSAEASKAAGGPALAQIVAPQTQAVVQQQLEALATQNFSWQGQVWPGQEMRWEIDENAARRRDDDETAARWATRLRLVLPNLGEVDAQIRLHGNQVTLAVNAESSETRTLLRAAGLALRTQLGEAGLTLAAMGVEAVSEGSVDGQG